MPLSRDFVLLPFRNRKHLSHLKICGKRCPNPALQQANFVSKGQSVQVYQLPLDWKNAKNKSNCVGRYKHIYIFYSKIYTYFLSVPIYKVWKFSLYFKSLYPLRQRLKRFFCKLVVLRIFQFFCYSHNERSVT